MLCQPSHFITAIAILGATTINAQEVVSSLGSSYSSDAARIDITIGELAIETYATSTVTSTQGFHQVYISEMPTGINESSLDVSVKIYPNPASDFLKIQADSFSELEYQLHDLNGKLISQSLTKVGAATIDIRGLPDGVFHLSLIDITTKKLNKYLIIKRQ